MKHLKDERGIAFIVEILLAALVLVVIGAAVYTSMQAKKTPETAASPTPTPKATAPTPSNSAGSTTYLTVKELGIKLPLTSDIKDLNYIFASSPGAEGKLQFSTASISSFSNGLCAASHEPLGLYGVYGSAQSDPSVGTLVANVKGKFIYYSHVQFACGDTDQERAKVSALIDPLLTAVKGAQAAQ